jgi:hypothetical protein
MSMRRPTASDRDLAQWIYRLSPGNYRIDVTDQNQAGQGGPAYSPVERKYTGLARLKHEGGLIIDMSDKLIEIYPIR